MHTIEAVCLRSFHNKENLIHEAQNLGRAFFKGASIALAPFLWVNPPIGPFAAVRAAIWPCGHMYQQAPFLMWV